MQGMNKSLDLIEHEVRFTQIRTANIEQLLLANIPTIQDMNARLIEIGTNTFDSSVRLDLARGFLESIDGNMWYVHNRLEWFSDPIMGGSESQRASEAILGDIRESVRNDANAREEISLLTQIRDAVRSAATAKPASLGAAAATQGFVFA
jgi:hypothetical protein